MKKWEKERIEARTAVLEAMRLLRTGDGAAARWRLYDYPTEHP